ncbi:hypothetical protein [uncultured Phycicoccus sp.]|uniref:hypothetical protein n=1 Tax=uncultured Phycicoccus sp. TaxID=661422 RepID=UPI002637A0B3|nr:hypothetical protein [uncultured Phycicoccus sp.]
MSGEPSPDGDHRAVASYVSSEDVIARGCAVLVDDIERSSGYWRPFVVRHAAVAGLLVLVPVALHVAGLASRLGVLRGVSLLLAVFAGLTALDLWRSRRALRRMVRATVEHGCPVGTRVSAVYTPDRIVFALPTHEIVIDPATITRARFVRRVLLLDQEDAERAWAVPVELVGQDGLRILRDTLGARFVER